MDNPFERQFENSDRPKMSPKRANKRPCGDDYSGAIQPKVMKLSSAAVSLPKKFSANDRLNRYRENVQGKKNEVCRVHTLEKLTSQKNTTSSHHSVTSVESTTDIMSAANKRHSAFNPNQQFYSNTISKLPWQSTTSNFNERVVKFDAKVPVSKTSSVQNRLFKHKKGTFDCERYQVNKTEQVNSSVDVNGNPFLANLSAVNSLEDDMDMEWTPVDDNDVLWNVERIRESHQVSSYKTEFQQSVAEHAKQIPDNDTIFKDIYVVVDTNIFLSKLNVVREILSTKLNGIEEPHILIPWMVIQELDFIKDGHSGNRELQRNARVAIRFINEKLTQKNGRMKGQTVLDASNQGSCGPNADDSILACCLQVVKKGNQPILLTNDTNLRNKALINQVDVYSHQSIMAVLNPSQGIADESHKSQVTDIVECLEATLNRFIVHEMKEAYGDLWEKMGMMQDRPWSLEGCLHRMEKYWMAVYSAFVQKQCSKLVQDFRKYLKGLDESVFGLKSTKDRIFELGIGLCIYLKSGYKRHYASINECVRKMRKIVSDVKQA